MSDLIIVEGDRDLVLVYFGTVSSSIWLNDYLLLNKIILYLGCTYVYQIKLVSFFSVFKQLFSKLNS